MANRVSSHSIRITADQQAAQATSRNVRRALSTSFPIEIAKEFAKITKQVRQEMEALSKAQQQYVNRGGGGRGSRRDPNDPAVIERERQRWEERELRIADRKSRIIDREQKALEREERTKQRNEDREKRSIERKIRQEEREKKALEREEKAKIRIEEREKKRIDREEKAKIKEEEREKKRIEREEKTKARQEARDKKNLEREEKKRAKEIERAKEEKEQEAAAARNAEKKSKIAEERRIKREKQRDRDLRRRSFWGGMAQGIGLADYFPADQGMRMRAAGLVTGRFFRHAGHIAASPFLNPGISGLTQALGGIPLVGGMAAGALNAISGMYGRAAGYDQARLANLYLMGGDPLSQGRALISGRPIIEAEAQKIEAEAKRKVQTAQQILAMQRGSTRGQNLVRLAQQGNTSAQHVLSNMRMANTLHLLGSMSGANATNPYVRSSVPIDSADIKKEEQNLASAKNYLLKATGDAAKYRQQAMGRLFGQLFGGDKIGAGFGVPYGMAPEAVQSFLGQYYGARGGDLQEPGTRGRVRQAMIAQTLFGVGAQLSGGFGRAELTGARSDRGGMLNILASAVLQGLRGSQIQEYLQEMVNQGRTAEQQGIKINQDDFARQTAFLSQYAGLNPVQATRIGGGLRGVTQQIGAQGIQTPQQYLMLRAAGFDPSQGRAGYLRAIEGIEGGLDAEGMQRLMGMITQGTWGLEGATPDDTRRMQLLGIKRFFSAVGIPIGFDQAEKLYKTFAIKGPPTSMEAYQEALAPLGAKGIMGQLDVAARGKAGAFAPLAVTQAGMGAEQIKIGREMADTFTKLNKIGLTMADTLTNFKDGLDAIVKLMDMLSKTLNKTTKGGFGGIVSRVLGITP